MGLVVLVICAPVLIPLLIILFVLGFKGDEWFNHAPPHSKGRDVYLYNEDGEIVDMYRDKTGQQSYTVLTDDEIEDEFGDEFLF